MELRNGNCPPQPWGCVRVAAWTAGVFYLSAPFNLFWRLGNGNLGHNILITLALVAAGITVAVPLAVLLERRCRLLSTRSSARVARLAMAGFSLAVAGGAASLWVGFPKWGAPVSAGVSLFGLLFGLLALLVVFRGGKIPARCWRAWRQWMRRRWPYNGAFWIVVFLLLVGGDLFALWSLDGLNVVEYLSAGLARVTTSAVLTIGLMLLFHAMRGLTPKFLRPMVVGLFSSLPLLIVIDFLLRQFWRQSLLSVLNLFTSTGAFDFHKEVAAAGLNWSLGGVALVGAVVIGLCLAFFWGLGKLSWGAGFRTANRSVLWALLICWLVAVAEGGLSRVTKRTESWQKQHGAFTMNLGVFAPPLGFELIEVAFREPGAEADRERLLAELEDAEHLRKPDIYVFMIESWRTDSVRPEVAPFLSKFRDEQAQELGVTFAGSNCTPMSWFSFFHSRVAIHWSEALDAAGTEPGLTGAYPLRVLDKIGYEIGVRAVCDLGYKSLGELNFGKGNYLADHLSDDSVSREAMSIPEREIVALDALKEHISRDPQRPQFHLMALDAPHYNYYWPEGFEVPHGDCANNIPTNLRPSDEVIGGVVRRYENAVHWIDHAIGEFVEFLKEQGRYEDSVIIITGDHGEEFQEEGSWFHCSALNRYQTEVPIIIKWPEWLGELPTQTNVSHLDVMPSVLDMIGLEPKFYELLSGRTLLPYSETPREAVISTVHRGESGVGLCLVRGERKVKFAFGGPWSTRAPKRLHVTGYTDLLDRPVAFRENLGTRTHADFIKAGFPEATGRFFDTFEKE